MTGIGSWHVIIKYHYQIAPIIQTKFAVVFRRDSAAISNEQEMYGHRTSSGLRHLEIRAGQ